MSLGESVREAREKARMTVRQLAERSGLSPQEVSDVEHDRTPDCDLGRIAEALGVPKEDLVAARDTLPSDFLSDKPELVKLLRAVRRDRTPTVMR